MIGTGGRGTEMLRHFAGTGFVDARALCDVYPARYEDAPETAPGARHFADHRDLLAQPGVDAVLIAAPGHWHKEQACDAMNAGKDVYLEKPLCRNREEMTAIVETARATGRICQVGLQERSNEIFLEARERFVLSGALGRVTHVDAIWNSLLPEPLPQEPAAKPQNLDWARFLGPIPYRDWNPAQYWRYRAFLDFGGGRLADLGHHWIDAVHLFLGDRPPRSAVFAGGVHLPANDGRTAPDTINALFDYRDFTVLFQSNAYAFRAESGLTFRGEKGWLFVNRTRWQFAEAGATEPVEREAADTSNEAHIRNFLASCQTRQPPNAPAGLAAVSMLAPLAALQSCREQRLGRSTETSRQPSERDRLPSMAEPPPERTVTIPFVKLHLSAVLAFGVLAGCGSPTAPTTSTPAAGSPSARSDVQEFLAMYSDVDRRLATVSSEADWAASTDVTEQHTGERIGAGRALAGFRGNRYIIDRAKNFLNARQSLGDLEFRQIDNILLNAAESPGTIPDIVNRRVETEARVAALMDGFTFCLEPRGDKCAKPVTPNEIDNVLAGSKNLAERARIWEVSKQAGPVLKKGVAELRDLRNRVASELGYSSYLHLQVADYGMTVPEMMQLMDKTVNDLQPLYEQLHLYTRRKLAARYQQPVPKTLPAHWVGNRWAQEWPGLVEAAELDDLFRGKSPEWIVQQAERFYVSLGMPALPKSFWEKSDLYQLPPGAARKKNTHASAWHIDGGKDVRSLMSVVPNFNWFETSHHELGHVYYYIAYSNPRVPHVLREGANRAFHEAVGDLIAIAARQPEYLRGIGLMGADRQIDPVQLLLSEALGNTVVFVPFSAGTMTHFEYELYEKKLPVDQFNRKWWELAARYQGVTPPSERSEQFCDACTKTHIVDDAAQYYDYAMAYLIKYQLHDYIARKILKQDPRNCNYYGNKEVGKWLWDLLSVGATQDWRQLIKEKTGEEISSRAMLDYFQPLVEYLKKENGGQPGSWQ